MMTPDTTAAMPLDLAREIARQAELRLDAVMTLTNGAVVRATMLCGIFGTASVGLGAAVLAYWGTEHASLRLIISGTSTATLLFLAAIMAAFAGAPRDFWIAGGAPHELRTWAWRGTQWRSEAELLDAIAQRLGKAIEADRQILEQESRRVIQSLWVALGSILFGLFVYIAFPHVTRFF